MGLGWWPALLALLLGLGGGSRAQEQLPRESHNLNWHKVSLAAPSLGAGARGVRAAGRGPLKSGMGWWGAWALVCWSPGPLLGTGWGFKTQLLTVGHSPELRDGYCQVTCSCLAGRGGGVSGRALE